MKIVRSQARVAFPQLRGALGGMTFPAFAELKFDGEFDEFHWKKGSDPFLLNKHGTMRTDWSVLDYIASQVEKSGINEIVMVGELMYKMGVNGDLYKLLSNKDNNEDLRYIPFDVIKYNGASITNQPLVARKEALAEINIIKSQPLVVNDKLEVQDYFNSAVDSKFEGIVVKGLESRYIVGPCDWVKIKYKDQSDYEVVAIDQTRERIEVLIWKGQTSNRTCGVKVSNKDKAQLKLGDWVTIEHQGVLQTGGLRHPVYRKRRTSRNP